ncbi:hypothetical protein [Streptomyces sp. RM72]|uniref:hypothetical protein n=1 Tax=Streptomyces sp. RM72 TaxID=1115510 RepID=UPI001B3589EA|nr:hypothetical protein [Streptomyces sp. RM72]
MTAPGSGWFGDPGAGPRARGGSDADRTEVLGSRIGGLPPHGRGQGPLAQGRITWGTTDPAGATPGPGHGRAPGPRPPHGTGHGLGPGTRPGPAPDPDRTDVLPSAPPAAPVAPTRAFPAPASPPSPVPPPGPATAVLRDPWQELPDAEGDAGAAAGHTHDPHEVTVQLDAVHLGDGVLLRADGGHRKSGPEASDGPVFVDASGRRSRLYRRLGILVGVACAVYAVVIASTLFSGNSDAPWKPVPGQEEGAPAGRVDTTPQPSRSAPPPSGAAAPQATPSAGAGAATEPGDEAPASGTSGVAGGSTEQAGTTVDPESSVPGTDRTPGDGGATGPDPTQSTQVPPPDSTDPSAPAGGSGTSVDPTGPTGGSTTGTDPGAGGSDGAAPLAGRAGTPVVLAGPGDISTSPPPPPSPENHL